MWKQGWPAYLASQRSWIIAQIDGRGSGGGGDRRRFELYQRLGTVEVDDQIEVAKYLAKHLPIVDPRRVAIWGWSYGGYATLRALSDPRQDVLQCGIAVAPVSSWRFYDSVYAERYMGFPGPEGNFKGYEESDVLSRAKHFKQTEKALKRLLLIHGTRDDNVHLQHSMVLARALIQNGVDFDQLVYPDATHNMESVSTHFYLSMEKFFTKCFAVKSFFSNSHSGKGWNLLSFFYAGYSPGLRNVRQRGSRRARCRISPRMNAVMKKNILQFI